ncbi:microsomal glutathione S-transferase 1-like isoform X1 [Lycorma delicatula]|uniref:microsomal glutathione S-transferase 1-like isoform X1 n=1 Tax=Lycorma delicatula TaxID=130591 RepID=UPI003F516284
MSKLQSTLLYSTENPVFNAYLFYIAILCLKVLLMVLLIGRQRHRKHIFISPEDTALNPKAKVKYDDPDIERVRRAHMNDLENIPIFAIAALLYIATRPDYFIALNLFRVFTIARIIHTFVYAVVVIPQPARAISWGIAYVITIYMAVKVILFTL